MRGDVKRRDERARKPDERRRKKKRKKTKKKKKEKKRGKRSKNRNLERGETPTCGNKQTRGAFVPRPVKYRRRIRIINDGRALACG